jgi:hypothetical protein
MLEGRLREGFVRIRQLMVCSTLPPYLLLADTKTGINPPRNPSPRPLQSSTLLSPHRRLRALLRIPRRSAPILTLLPPALHDR